MSPDDLDGLLDEAAAALVPRLVTLADRAFAEGIGPITGWVPAPVVPAGVGNLRCRCGAAYADHAISEAVEGCRR